MSVNPSLFAISAVGTNSVGLPDTDYNTDYYATPDATEALANILGATTSTIGYQAPGSPFNIPVANAINLNGQTSNAGQLLTDLSVLPEGEWGTTLSAYGVNVTASQVSQLNALVNPSSGTTGAGATATTQPTSQPTSTPPTTLRGAGGTAPAPVTPQTSTRGLVGVTPVAGTSPVRATTNPGPINAPTTTASTIFTPSNPYTTPATQTALSRTPSTYPVAPGPASNNQAGGGVVTPISNPNAGSRNTGARQLLNNPVVNRAVQATPSPVSNAVPVSSLAAPASGQPTYTNIYTSNAPSITSTPGGNAFGTPTGNSIAVNGVQQPILSGGVVSGILNFVGKIAQAIL